MSQSQSVGEQVRRLLDEKSLSLMLGVSVAFLRKDRYGARILPFMRIGDLVRYDAERIREALLSREVGGDATGPRAETCAQEGA